MRSIPSDPVWLSWAYRVLFAVALPFLVLLLALPLSGWSLGVFLALAVVVFVAASLIAFNAGNELYRVLRYGSESGRP